mgnify:CR=1 FL=1
MASYTFKAPAQLSVPGSTGTTFYSGNNKNDGIRTSSSVKGKFRIALLPSVSSNTSLIKSSFKKDLSSPLIMNESTHQDLLPKSSQSGFFSPKLAPIRPRRGRNTQSVDYTNTKKSPFFHADSKVDDSTEYLSKMARKSSREDLMCEDEKPTHLIGEEAITEFYSHYKHLDKIVDQNRFKDIKDSMYTSFLRRSEDLHLFPAKIGLIKSRGDKTKISIE